MPRTTRLISTIFVLYAFVWLKGWPRTYDDEELPAARRPHQPGAAFGPHPVVRDQLVVSITTTAINVYSKAAPLILNTQQADHEMLLLFSDLQAEIGSWPVFDVIWRLPSDVIMKSDELNRYRTQLEYSQRSIPLEYLRKPDPEDERKEMQLLNKYKMLQTMAAAWDYRPGRSWYIFADDETYIHRPNLMDWLSQHDSEARHFFANPPTDPTALVPDPFAAGGTSFILSRKVMKELFVDRRDAINNWATRISHHVSAFDLVSTMLKEELDLDFVAAWPGISGFDPTTVTFHPSLWCEPILMMHHVAPDMLGDLSKLEREQASDRPLHYADLWDRFFTPENLNYTRTDWDNLSSEPTNGRWNILFETDQVHKDRAKSGEQSPEACEQSCEQNTYCVQWSYSSIPQRNWNDNAETKCHLSSSIRFGLHVRPKDMPTHGPKATLSWQSGWKKARFHRWARQQQCHEQHQ